MLFPRPMRRGRLIQRYKRFLADVAFEDGEETTVHVPNPGAMLGLNTPGMTVWCSDSGSATRKLPLTWELVEADGGLVGVNTHNPNKIVAEALRTGAIAEVAGYTSIRPEVKYGEASRIDFLLESPDRPPCGLEVNNPTPKYNPAPRVWLEVKNCHFSRVEGVAEFPDCVAARSAKHLRELEAMVAARDRAVIIWVVQRTDCDQFAPASDLDPAFARALRQAVAAGVEAYAYRCDVETTGVTLTERITVRL